MINAIEQKQWIRRLRSDRSETEKILLLSSCFGIVLLTTRIIVTGSLMYGFLVWNLFLAYVPFVVTNGLIKNQRWLKNRFKAVCLFLFWLLFIPNSFYIITDLFHLDKGKSAPQWFDLALIFSFAWNGLMIGILSIREMERIIELQVKSNLKWFFVYAVMWLNALGIYIGRYLRFNSWDIITNPFQLAGDIVYLGIHPLRNDKAWAMIICFAILMTLIYKSIRNISRELFK
jgi:uncharacterized membrane protein